MIRKLLVLIVLLFVSPAASAWTFDPRWPQWEVKGVRYALTIQETTSQQLIILFWTGDDWNSWGAYDDNFFSIGGDLGDVTDENIMARGSLHAYLTWALAEAMRRSKLHSRTPVPLSGAPRLARADYALKELVTVGKDADGPVLQLAPAPLP